ncbi:MAG TPA: hypothetical protein VN540_10060 [Clostridia bacterium]|nr:hypothetical protein [Clostridia bacterium]
MMRYEQQQNIGFRYAVDLLEPSSPYGRARVAALRFFSPDERPELERQLGNVYKTLFHLEPLGAEYEKLALYMMPLKDIRRSVEACREAALSETELFELKRFCLQSGLIAPVFERVKKESGLAGIGIAAQEDALRLLDPENTRSASFYLPDTSSQALHAIRRNKSAVEEKLRRTDGREERAALLAERSEITAAEDAEEIRLRARICESLQPFINGLLACMDGIADFDFTLARAKLAKAYGACEVEFTENDVAFTDMLNPRVADALGAGGGSFTPVSIEAGPGAALITGANMGGKSVALKTLALNALLVKAGLLPFAGKARLPLFEGIYLVAEDREDVSRGLSSFGAEIAQFNEALSSALSSKRVCLLLFDEFARGTNPEEGALIVRAVTRRLNSLPHVSVLTTHYDGVAEFAGIHYEVAGLRDMDMAAVAREIAANREHGAQAIAKHMNYGLYRAEGKECVPRDARNICMLLGMDEEILKDIFKPNA